MSECALECEKCFRASFSLVLKEPGLSFVFVSLETLLKVQQEYKWNDLRTLPSFLGIKSILPFRKGNLCHIVLLGLSSFFSLLGCVPLEICTFKSCPVITSLFDPDVLFSIRTYSFEMALKRRK